MEFSPSIEKVIEGFAKLPGIGKKTAERLAFHIIQENNKEVQTFLNAIVEAKKSLKVCSKCFNISDTDPCYICEDEKRNKEVLCIVEGVRDVIAFENSDTYNGLYHVLGGKIDPLNGVTIEDLNLKSLIKRLDEKIIKEVIIALNPDLEGETTTLYLTKILKQKDVRVSKIASGIPMGGNIEFTDMATLGRSLEGRREIE